MYDIDYEFSKLFEDDSDLVKSIFFNIVNKLDTNSIINILKIFATIKPIYTFSTIISILREFDERKEYINDLNFLELYSEKKFDVFMLSNYLVKNNEVIV